MDCGVGQAKVIFQKIWNIKDIGIWKMNGAILGQTAGWSLKIHETPKILASPELWLICYLLTPFFPFHHHILVKDVFIPSPVLFIHQMMIIMTKYWLACVCYSLFRFSLCHNITFINFVTKFVNGDSMIIKSQNDNESHHSKGPNHLKQNGKQEMKPLFSIFFISILENYQALLWWIF